MIARTTPPLHIAIVGGGIAGFTAAIALRQTGASVTVFERSSFANEVGAAIHAAPNAARVLQSLGFNFDRANAMKNMKSLLIDGRSDQILSEQNLATIDEVYGTPWYLLHRVDLHSELKSLATDSDGPGTPVELRIAAPVITVDPEQPSLILKDGSKHLFDLIIGADGVHSTVANQINPSMNPAQETGQSAYRFLIPTEILNADPNTRWLMQEEPCMRIFTLPDRRMAVYPCRNGTLMNFVAIHPDKDLNTREDWNRPGTLAGLLAAFADFSPSLLAVCRHAESMQDLKIWKLFYRSPMDNWVRGKVCLIGDAAHPMLPHRGQGGGQAIEDAGALGELFQQLPSKDLIPKRLALFQQLRFKRASIIQILSNVGYDQAELMADEASKYMERPLNHDEFQHYLLGYDIRDVARETLQQLKA